MLDIQMGFVGSLIRYSLIRYSLIWDWKTKKPDTREANWSKPETQKIVVTLHLHLQPRSQRNCITWFLAIF